MWGTDRIIRHTKGLRLLRLVNAAFWIAILPASLAAHGQTFQFDAGSSSLFHAQGGGFHFTGSDYEGWLSAGLLNGQLVSGAFVQKQWRSYTIGAGDDAYLVTLPTDIFEGSHYFWGRGANIAFSSPGIKLSIFGGATSLRQVTPFFSGAQAQTPIGYISADIKITPKINLFSRNVIGTQSTSISGLEFLLPAGWKSALALGVGTDRPYGALSLAGDWHWFKFKGAYVIANRDFQRVGMSSPSSTENDKENLEIEFRPIDSFSFSAARFNLVQAPTKEQAGNAAVVNQLTASAKRGGFQFIGSLFSSQTDFANAQGWSASAGRSIGDRLQASTSFFRNTSNRGPPSSSWEQSLREIFSPRLSVLEILTHSDGDTSFSWGGSFLSNPIAVDVEYQTVYSPFNPLKPFHQVLLLNVRLQPLGALILNAASFVTPEGTVKYATYGSAWIQRGDTVALLSPRFRLNKFMVSGHVVDQAGNPVEGAALRVNDELVFSDSAGSFFLRVKKRKIYKLAVFPSDFMCPGRFQVISAPSRIISTSSDSETAGIIVVRRLDSSGGSLH